MPFQPSDTLRSRTFVGLIVAQFLASFNDQAIHAAAMFFAINTRTLSESSAISLMPILFYAPWALFCTLAGYLADRFSKRHALVTWKVAEVGITLLALAGFCLGTFLDQKALGAALVLSTVFLMGTHAAFFAPAKYGAMPEILRPQVLSKGNGVLESTTFLAAILGTVSGGLLSTAFRGEEYWIGLILFGLAVVGAAASLLIEKMPAANPTRPFPVNLFRPLLDNVRTMARSRPLALAVLGIAFFVFMTAFMRATVYMHGESRNPRWTESETSFTVAFVALGVGLGSPLAGWLSGKKVELGLVPLGAVGMIVATLVAAVTINFYAGLVVCLVLIGFCSGFYIVPLYTLLQHRAPKTSKGDLVATSNFFNVTGAIAASLLFFALVFLVERFVPPLEQKPFAEGRLLRLTEDGHGRPESFRVRLSDGTVKGRRAKGRLASLDAEDEDERPDKNRIEVLGDVQAGEPVAVTRYRLGDITYYRVRPADAPPEPAYDLTGLPRFLFVGASLMTLGILVLLCRQLPDFFLRALLWLRAHGRYRLQVAGLQNLPADGPVILATNCDRLEKCMQVIAATDRFTRFVLLERNGHEEPSGLLRYLARRTGLVSLRPGADAPEAWDRALARAAKALGQGNLLGLTADGQAPPDEVRKFLDELRGLTPAPIVPVYCGAAGEAGPAARQVHVVIGPNLGPEAAVEEVHRSIRLLGERVRQAEAAG
jgi:MFS family permease